MFLYIRPHAIYFERASIFIEKQCRTRFRALSAGHLGKRGNNVPQAKEGRGYGGGIREGWKDR